MIPSFRWAVHSLGPADRSTRAKWFLQFTRWFARQLHRRLAPCSADRSMRAKWFLRFTRGFARQLHRQLAPCLAERPSRTPVFAQVARPPSHHHIAPYMVTCTICHRRHGIPQRYAEQLAAEYRAPADSLNSLGDSVDSETDGSLVALGGLFNACSIIRSFRTAVHPMVRSIHLAVRSMAR
jgi:hypothetical protein